jgi:hypothetical protein
VSPVGLLALQTWEDQETRNATWFRVFTAFVKDYTDLRLVKPTCKARESCSLMINTSLAIDWQRLFRQRQANIQI